MPASFLSQTTGGTSQSSSPTVETISTNDTHNDQVALTKVMAATTSSSRSSSPPSDIPTPKPLSSIIDEKKMDRHFSKSGPMPNAVDREKTKRRSEYFGEAFAQREPPTSQQHKASKVSMVLAELKTNVIVKDEYTLITDLSSHLATRFSRPITSIATSITHSTCLLFANTFDPAYILTINALPSQLQPVTNKRNAALLANAMMEFLGVEKERGIIRFVAMPEENFAVGGVTYRGTIDTAEKKANGSGDGSVAAAAAAAKVERRNTAKRVKDAHRRSKSMATVVVPPSPTVAVEETESIPTLPTTIEPTKADRMADKAKKVGRRKSLLSMFGGK